MIWNPPPGSEAVRVLNRHAGFCLIVGSLMIRRPVTTKALTARRINLVVKDDYGLDLDRFLDGLAKACGVSGRMQKGESAPTARS